MSQPDTGWPVGRQADIAAWLSESEQCPHCEERHLREDMHQCDGCHGYTCMECFKHGQELPNQCAECGWQEAYEF